MSITIKFWMLGKWIAHPCCIALKLLIRNPGVQMSMVEANNDHLILDEIFPKRYIITHFQICEKETAKQIPHE